MEAGGGVMWQSMRQSCICDQEGLCESISKIIHFATATHFRLPLPIMILSGEGDRAGRGVAWGLLFNLSSTPWRPPPSQLSSPHMLLHLLHYSSDSHRSSSAAAASIKKKRDLHCRSRLSIFFFLKSKATSKRSRRERLCPHQTA